MGVDATINRIQKSIPGVKIGNIGLQVIYFPPKWLILLYEK
jgi:hypothetical protein